MYIFKNQTNEKIPRIDLIDIETINPHDLCYQCSKHGADFLFGKLRIKDFNVPKIKLISIQIQMNTLFNTNDERKNNKV